MIGLKDLLIYQPWQIGLRTKKYRCLLQEKHVSTLSGLSAEGDTKPQPELQGTRVSLFAKSNK